MIRAMQKIRFRGTGIVKAIAVCLVLLCAVIQTNSAAAQTTDNSDSERITAFRSDIHVRENGDIQVTETISVDARGVSIKRGIYRDIPLVTMNAAKLYDVGDIAINRIFIDGLDTIYSLEELDGAVRIYVGDPRRHLSIGSHTFTIIYTMSNQLSFGTDVDELYWNVTGNDWQFSIENATATIYLPDGATVRDLSVYTGQQGAAGAQYRVLANDGNQLKVGATATLMPRHGMTLAVSWPVGFVARPETIEVAAKILTDNKGIFSGLGLCLLLVAYYTLTWRKFGKDPDGPTVVPRFEPPSGMSAAEVGFIWRNAEGGQSFATKAFAVVLTSLAVKKRLTIKVTSKEEYVLTQLPGQPEDLPDDEQTVLNTLLRQSDSKQITIGQEYRKEVESARSFLLNLYSVAKRSKFFVRNSGQWHIGCVIGFVAVAATMMLDPAIGAHNLETTMGSIVGSVLLVGATTMTFYVLRKIWIAVANKGDTGRLPLSKGVIMAVGAFAPALGVGAVLTAAMSPIAILIAVSAVAICCLFHVLLEVPKAEFLKIRSEVEGYRRYLTVAEEAQLNFNNREMGDAIELFEKHLPFAMALDAEDVWTERLETFLNAIPVKQGDEAHQYNPSWYQDSRRGWRGIGNFGTRSVGQFSSAAVSYGAPSIPSVGIASRGGGFSGGGRGGGGGGGW
jgi:hypothetical protein